MRNGKEHHRIKDNQVDNKWFNLLLDNKWSNLLLDNKWFNLLQDNFRLTKVKCLHKKFKWPSTLTKTTLRSMLIMINPSKKG